ncbi:16S rRNA (guanine(527)-N(7))-methyltransferase RsmG [Desulfonatronum sp. SC1]|uniref:16S rRNA (guanine(527)-N(7))-methyltransferase RsmG n=1 Tax=Desulfonatronum sp. SC1 TaxID=2109626 RepID=UPI000D2FF321|nr:RsmG family class I SAM-dependent methyltransferase [Desulfonatronum sp. SC1]PTN35030.1 16S rRNA (guanine(527)-N(7))-methyltransferase RsmG [Desulfonatronum sp. SC1]
MTAKTTSQAPPTPDQIIALTPDLGRTLTKEQALGLSRYLSLLLQWNQRMNLVGPGDWRIILTDLVADSWLLADFLDTLPLLKNATDSHPKRPLAVDLGAGAGLPGLPLRLFWPQGTYHLVEIRRKRTAFLLQAVAAMGLRQTVVRPERAEQALPALAPLDLCLSRAFLPWPRLLELVRPWLAPEGLVLIMANEAPPKIFPSGWSLQAVRSYPSGDKTRYFWSLAAAVISR